MGPDFSEQLDQMKLINGTVLLDVSHAPVAGSEQKVGNIVVGRHEVSQPATWGTVIKVAEDADEKYGIAIGDIIAIPIQGLLRQVDYPGKDKNVRLVTVRTENVDLIIKK